MPLSNTTMATARTHVRSHADNADAQPRGLVCQGGTAARQSQPQACIQYHGGCMHTVLQQPPVPSADVVQLMLLQNGRVSYRLTTTTHNSHSCTPGMCTAWPVQCTAWQAVRWIHQSKVGLRCTATHCRVAVKMRSPHLSTRCCSVGNPPLTHSSTPALLHPTTPPPNPSAEQQPMY
jgi:hypothetical protein